MKIRLLAFWILYQIQLTFQQVCMPGLCENNGTCIEVPLKLNGFECQCSNDYHGKLCSNKLPDVECLSDRIVLTVQKNLILEEVNMVRNNFVYLGNNYFNSRECMSKNAGDDLVVTVMSPFEGKCGTKVYKNSAGNLMYSNRLFLDTTRDQNVTNSHRMVLLDWSCEYKSRYAVSFPYAIQYSVNRPERQVVYGKFTLDMSVYRDPLFTPQSKLRPPVDTSVGDKLYVQVELMTSAQQNDLVVTYKSCFASNTPDPSNTSTDFSHELITSGCPSRLDPSVKLHQSNNSSESAFSFMVFMWSNKEAPIYLHCVVSVCNITRFGDQCTPPCMAASRLRRDIDDVTEPDVTLTVGPINIKNIEPSFDLQFDNYINNTDEILDIKKHEINSGSTKPEYLILGILSAVGLIFIIILCVFVYLKRKNSNILKPKNLPIRTISSNVSIAPSRVEELDNVTLTSSLSNTKKNRV